MTARDKAILDALKIRPRSTEALAHVLPAEAGLSDDERAAALRSALIRLRVKKLIVAAPDGWAAA